MKNGLYRKLAWNNIRKNQSTFLPFGIVASCVVAVFYMIFSISAQSDAVYQGQQSMEMILKFGTIVVGIVAAVILLYTNRFVMKQRTKEFGLYNILGLEKKHIAKVLGDCDRRAWQHFDRSFGWNAFFETTLFDLY